MNTPSDGDDYLKNHIVLLTRSYRKLLGEELCVRTDLSETLEKQLFHAPFALLSHTHDSEPLFNYANLKALELFEMSWDELRGLPSRLSAETGCQEDRDRLLAEVSLKGFIKDYNGVRLSKTGKRFLIKNAVVWNLFNLEDGSRAGQAACFKTWEFL